MFIELLIVFGILGVLSAITIVAVNPRRHLCEAQNAKRWVTAREFTNAVNQYAIRARQPASGGIPDGEANAGPICRLGATGICIRLDVLVPEYLITLPVDDSEPDPALTGYRIYRRGAPVILDQVVSGHIEDCDLGSVVVALTTG